jgi:hypothetical protein
LPDLKALRAKVIPHRDRRRPSTARSRTQHSRHDRRSRPALPAAEATTVTPATPKRSTRIRRQGLDMAAAPLVPAPTLSARPRTQTQLWFLPLNDDKKMTLSGAATCSATTTPAKMPLTGQRWPAARFDPAFQASCPLFSKMTSATKKWRNRARSGLQRWSSR